MTVEISEETEVDFPFDYESTAKEVIRAALSYEKFPFEAEISLTLVDDDTIQAVNKEFRAIDRSTDVLSFPMLNFPCAGDFSLIEEGNEDFNPDTNEVILGDIMISVMHVHRQAEEYGHSLKREYAFLIAHSMLHLMGYDHMTDETMKEMENIQERILSGLGIERE